MLDPEFLKNISRPTEEITSELSEELVKLIAKRIVVRLEKGTPLISNTDTYLLETLQEAGAGMADIQAAIRKATGLQEAAIKKAFEDAGIKAQEYDKGVYEMMGRNLEDLQKSPSYLSILTKSYHDTLGQWGKYSESTARNAWSEIVTQCSKASMSILTGMASKETATVAAIKAIGEGGAYVTLPSGIRIKLESAMASLVRTNVSQACGRMTAQRAADNGVTLMLVSAHAGARPDHELWQGKIYWVDWERLGALFDIAMPETQTATEEEKKKYREFTEATQIGTPGGLEGINCRHSYGPYFEGMTNPFEGMKFPPGQFEKEQEARRMERGIRTAKKAYAGYKAGYEAATDPGTKEMLKWSMKGAEETLTKRIGDYYKYCSKHGMKPQEGKLYTL